MAGIDVNMGCPKDYSVKVSMTEQIEILYMTVYFLV